MEPVSYTHLDDFIAGLNAAAKQEKPDALVIGEVWEDASNKIAYSERRRYFGGGELDSVMNYPLRDAILAYLNGGTAEHFAETMETVSYTHLDVYKRQCFVCAEALERRAPHLLIRLSLPLLRLAAFLERTDAQRDDDDGRDADRDGHNRRLGHGHDAVRRFGERIREDFLLAEMCIRDRVLSVGI